MGDVIPFRVGSCDHVVIELLLVRNAVGAVKPRYFVNVVVDGSLWFGEYDTATHADAHAEARAYYLRIVDKTGAR
jgi:hypothetical protein